MRFCLSVPHNIIILNYIMFSTSKFFFSSKQCSLLVLLVFIWTSSFSLVKSVPVSYYNTPNLNLDVANNSLTSINHEQKQHKQHHHQQQQQQQSKPKTGVCRYQASVFSSGDLVPIEEPCLKCQCKNTAVVCKLRICPDIQLPPPGCILIHKAKKCCPQVLCPVPIENSKKLSRENRLSDELGNLTLNSLALPDDKGYCINEGTVYAEGSAMRASSLCEHCFCIRGEMKCSSPQCVIPLEGCKPRFRSYACCPTNYDCNESNSTAIVKSKPISTPIPQFLKGCQVAGRFVAEGEPVLPLNLGPDSTMNPCQTCFCMGGVIRCSPLQCDKPLHGCTPIIELGHCCPDRYQCLNSSSTSNNQMTPIPSASLTLETSTESQLISNQLPNNEVLTSRIVSNEKHFASSTHKQEQSESTVKLGSPDSGSREERRKKDQEELMGKLSHEEIDTSVGSSEHLTNVMSNNISVSTTESTSNNEATQPNADNFESKTDSISDILLSNYKANEDLSNEPDGEELTIALEVITENDLQETVTNSPTFDIEKSIPLIHNTNEPKIIANTSASELISDHSDSETTTFIPEASTTVLSSTPQKSFPTLIPSSTEEATTLNSELSDLIETSSDVSEMTTLQTSQNPNLVSETVTTTTESATSTVNSSSFTNLHFIPFGVEDAMFLQHPSDMEDETLDSYDPNHILLPAPIKITFDNTDVNKAHLIAPMPPKSYVHVPLLSQQRQEFKPSEQAKIPIASLNKETQVAHHHDDDDDSTKIITSSSIMNNDQKNSVFDVPVSTSLYNNGFFPNRVPPSFQNKSIFDHIFEDSGLVDEEDDEVVEGDDKGMRMNVTKVEVGDEHEKNGSSEVEHTTQLSNRSSTLTPTSINDMHELNHTESISTIPNTERTTLPSRIYSKFDINDSPYYIRFGESGYDLSSLPKTEEKQITPVDHHRYYQGPGLTKENVGFYPFVDYTTNENDEAEDELLVYHDDSLGIESHEQIGEPNFDTKIEKLSVTSPSPPTSMTTTTTTSSKIDHQSNIIISSTSRPSTIKSSTRSSTKPRKPHYPSSHKISSSTTTERPSLLFSPSNGAGGFKPVLAFPFVPFPKNKPLDALTHIGLKLSGCNIYGKMYGIGNIIRELSSNCVQCQCTEIGVQCSEIRCQATEDMLMMS